MNDGVALRIAFGDNWLSIKI